MLICSLIYTFSGRLLELSEHYIFHVQLRPLIAAVEISDRKDSNTLYKFRNLISVNRIFIKDYKVSVSI
jgi:hypothetical protein